MLTVMVAFGQRLLSLKDFSVKLSFSCPIQRPELTPIINYPTLQIFRPLQSDWSNLVQAEHI